MDQLKNPDSFVRVLKQRIIWSGILLISITFVIFLTQAYHNKTSRDDALRINIAGKQRMLLEQSLMYAYRISSLQQDTSVRQAQQLLLDNLSALTEHHALLSEGRAGKLPVRVSSASLEQLYYGVEGLDQQLSLFIHQASEIARAPLDRLPEIQQVYRLDLSVNPALLNKLDQVVTEYETISEAHTRQALSLSAIGVATSLLVILLIYRFLLSPYLKKYRANLQHHEVMLQNSRDLILFCSPTGDVLDCNDKAREHLMAAGMLNYNLLHWNIDLPELSDLSRQLPAIQQTLTLSDGTQWEAEIRFSVVRVSDQTHLTVFISDISHHKAYQQALIREKELAESAQKKAEEANQVKSEFIASVSHEFRTPLNAIMGFADIMAQDEALPEEYQIFTQEIQQSGQHLIHLVNNLLEYSQIESGQLECHLSREAMTPLIEQSCDMMIAEAEQQGIQLENQSADDLPDLSVDGLFFRQVMANLLSNGIKYNQAGGWVRVQTELSDQWLTVKVADNGTGIAEANGENIFRAFGRHHHTNSHISGAGLGLSICQYMIEQMGGKIGFSSELGEGSVFWFRLPREQQPVTV